MEAKLKRVALDFVIESYLHGIGEMDSDMVIEAMLKGEFPDGVEPQDEFFEDSPERLASKISAEANNYVVFANMNGLPGQKQNPEKLFVVAKCALADLEGIMPEFDPSGDREHSAWKTIDELKAALGVEAEVGVEQTELTEVQKAITELYCEGDMSHVTTLEAAQNCGDGLLTFLINESGDAENISEYIGMVASARYQLGELLGDLEVWSFNRNEKSYEEAAQIVSGKVGCELVDATVDKTYDGKVMGVTDMHVALSLGRAAVIIRKEDMDVVPAKDEEVVVKFASGLGYVELVKAKLIER